MYKDHIKQYIRLVWDPCGFGLSFLVEARLLSEIDPFQNITGMTDMLIWYLEEDLKAMES